MVFLLQGQVLNESYPAEARDQTQNEARTFQRQLVGTAHGFRTSGSASASARPCRGDGS